MLRPHKPRDSAWDIRWPAGPIAGGAEACPARMLPPSRMTCGKHLVRLLLYNIIARQDAAAQRADRLTTAHGPGQPSRLRISVRRDLPQSRGRRGHHHARGQRRRHERTSERDQQPGYSWRSCRADLRWCWLAPNRRQATGSRQYHPGSSASLRAGTEPDGEHRGVPARRQNSAISSGTHTKPLSRPANALGTS